MVKAVTVLGAGLAEVKVILPPLDSIVVPVGMTISLASVPPPCALVVMEMLPPLD